MKLTKLLFLILLVINIVGCATSGYLIDRGHDAADIFTATVGIGAGVKIRAGTLNLAPVCYSSDIIGLRGGTFLFLCDNIFDMWTLFYGVEGYVPCSSNDPRRKSFSNIISYKDGLQSKGGSEQYSQFEVLLGLGITFRLGFNPGELVDFILGWSTIDIYNDDIGNREAEIEKIEQDNPPDPRSSGR